MSKLSRIELLKTYAVQEPENPFNWYALALEYQDSDPGLAALYFGKLLSEHQSYLPAYYHAAAFFSEKGDIALAREVYEKGILLAGEQKDEKAMKELNNSFQNFLFENDLL